MSVCLSGSTESLNPKENPGMYKWCTLKVCASRPNYYVNGNEATMLFFNWNVLRVGDVGQKSELLDHVTKIKTLSLSCITQ